jgi:hypothetical protein
MGLQQCGCWIDANRIPRCWCAVHQPTRDSGDAAYIDSLETQRDLLLNAVMLAILNIDCERNGLTPDGNVRQRLVDAIAKIEKGK